MSKSVNVGYKFDHINRRVIITREFNKKANVFDSNEYKTLQKLRRELPDYTVDFAAPHRKTSQKSHMTLARMLAYIERQPDKDAILADLEMVRYPKDSIYAAPFPVVKEWFFTRFPNYGRMTSFDENGKIIEMELAG